MKAHINNKEISQDIGVYIVLEAGPTHYGLESAKELVKLAKNAGADSVKFQLLYADRLMADKEVNFSYKYLSISETGEEQYIENTEPLYDILKRRELTKEEWVELKAFCDDQKIHMFTTVTYPDEVDFIVDVLKVDTIKINSGDVKEIDFIKYCARKGVNLQFDTGNADIWEIERAVIAAEEEGCDNIIIHLCPTGYPARVESINLKMIQTLKMMFPNCSVAFSDHSPGWNMDIAAVGLGAEMLEKTITLDRTIKSCEHSFSLEENDAIEFVKSIREVELALGSYRRTIPAVEKEKRKLGRRSPYAIRTISKGEAIKDSDFEFRRPGFGVTTEDFKSMIGKKITMQITKDEKLTNEFV